MTYRSLKRALINPFYDDPRQNLWLVPFLSLLLLSLAFFGEILFKDATSVIWIVFCFFFILWVFSYDLLYATHRSRPLESILLATTPRYSSAVLGKPSAPKPLLVSYLIFTNQPDVGFGVHLIYNGSPTL